MARGTACGKVILLGEHAVVYGRPAIAVPMSNVRAQADVKAAANWEIVALDLDRRYTHQELALDEVVRPLWHTIGNTLEHLGIAADAEPLRVTIRSAVPIARGMGSGTAVATALVRAVAAHHGRRIGEADVCDLVFRTEVLLHGRPSGIDNTVVGLERPVFYVRGEPPQPLDVGASLTLLVVDSGVAASTMEAVNRVRRRWEQDRPAVERTLDRIADLVVQARLALAAGRISELGALMDANHALLETLGVSSPTLDHLATVARRAGALGCKLTGGGLGGCLVALVSDGERDDVAARVLEGGAAQVLPTVLRPSLAAALW